MKMFLKYKNQKGFSLVELMIVIAILAILAAVAVPSLQRFAINSDLRSAARAIQGDFFDLKERAISENRRYAITFNVNSSTYSIEQPPGTVIETRDLRIYRDDIVITSASFAGGIPSVTFQTRGTVSGTGGSVSIKNILNSTATIRINITGKTSVQYD